MSTQIILLERVESLGQMGDVVSVKPGYARNYLLPQGKALRATKDNVAYFETQKKSLEAENLKKKKDAEAVAKKMGNVKVSIIRNASESGQLYGSVTSRDIAEGVTAAGFTVEKSQIDLNQTFKMIGLFPVSVVLHPEVKVEVTLNIARSEEEAKIQDKTGKALVAGSDEDEAPKVAAPAEDETKSEFLEDSALEAEKEQAELDAAKAAEEEAKAAEKAEKKAAKAAAEAEAQASAEEAETSEETAETEETEEKA